MDIISYVGFDFGFDVDQKFSRNPVEFVMPTTRAIERVLFNVFFVD